MQCVRKRSQKRKEKKRRENKMNVRKRILVCDLPMEFSSKIRKRTVINENAMMLATINVFDIQTKVFVFRLIFHFNL